MQVQRRGRGWLAIASLVAVVLTSTLAFPPSALLAATADTTPPTVPGGLSASVAPRRHIELTWHASTDDLAGAIRYRVFRDDLAIGQLTIATSYVDRPPLAGTYRYKVRAIDQAGNKSPFSYSIARTVTPGPVDATSPGVPDGLAATQGPEGDGDIVWLPSSDDRAGTVWYHVLRDGRRVATVEATGFADWPAGLPGASHSYALQAADGAGNVSAPSEAIGIGVSPNLYPWAGVARRHGTRSESRVALTFDDGYRIANVQQIVRILRDLGAPATFFPAGEAVERAPALWADIARDFPLGNHTYAHRDLTTLTPADMEDELIRATLALESGSQRPIIPLMRPPYGARNSTVAAVADQLGLGIALWDIDTFDWRSMPPEAIRDRALAATNGSIILLHDYPNTVAALPAIIRGLRKRGYTLVSLDELLGVPWQAAFR